MNLDMRLACRTTPMIQRQSCFRLKAKRCRPFDRKTLAPLSRPWMANQVRVRWRKNSETLETRVAVEAGKRNHARSLAMQLCVALRLQSQCPLCRVQSSSAGASQASDDAATTSTPAASSEKASENASESSGSKSNSLSRKLSVLPEVGMKFVKVIVAEAQGLQAADLTGSSDPFVKIEMDGVRVGKTAHINRSLSPKWANEEFDVVLELDTFKKLTFLINDHNLIGHSTPIGMCEITRENLYDGEQWLDVVPQKKEKAKGKLLIRLQWKWIAFSFAFDLYFLTKKKLNSSNSIVAHEEEEKKGKNKWKNDFCLYFFDIFVIIDCASAGNNSCQHNAGLSFVFSFYNNPMSILLIWNKLNRNYISWAREFGLMSTKIVMFVQSRWLCQKNEPAHDAAFCCKHSTPWWDGDGTNKIPLAFVCFFLLKFSFAFMFSSFVLLWCGENRFHQSKTPIQLPPRCYIANLDHSRKISTI